MPRRQQPTARQERLGAELRKLREAAGLKGREAAALLGTDSGQISQIEAGTAGVSEERVRRLAAHYSCTDGELIDALVAMATDRTRGWWEEYRDHLPTPFLDLPELEHHASYRWDVDFLHVPGLLQTPDYARALFAFVNPEFPASDVDRWVEHRMKRRTIIERPDPVPYATVIHEAALRIRVGDRTATRAQLTRILEQSEVEHITVRVIPFDLDGFGGAGSAMVYAGGLVPQLDTLVRDSPNGPVFVNAEAQLSRYRTLFHKVEALSLEPVRSRDFIHRLTKEL
ncbi:helix-turn-helix domain-containing protein [Streptomyces justiciae]|uniref:helix-turn-helix domain-containing protein n=1 Tax=Streptomyces justiciae TaxID=2780140 RepID=UPI0018816626|nr:helix-turn-helix transcriptional regulator [Streptomyces justiciae]MBE8477818.1 helix-turn-helix domain-containing protein [Streptomyces justiciae]MCW8379500.1 helix-turn-helix domain-containing protein [Streptomyces justiciae]